MKAFIFFFNRTRGLLFIVLAFATVAGCGDKNIVQTPEQPQPEWIGQRPRNASYYIGVGSSSKLAQPLDYPSVAKKNALNDLASEIKVRVQGETFLNSLEVNKNFSEEFISTISTTTDESIENYEIAGQWENKQEYWVYYRLSKSEYQRLKSEQKNLALSTSNDYYVKGLEAEQRANIPAAVDLYLRGLFALKEYWNEPNEFLVEGKKTYLDNDIYAALRRVITGLTLVPAAEKIILSSENNYATQFPVQVMYEGQPARGISLSYTYQRDRYMKPRVLLSDQGGRTTADVSHVSTTVKANWLDIVIDIESLLPQDLDKSIELGLVKTMKTESRRIPIELILPSFFIQSEERVYGTTGSTAILASSFQSELVKRGMRISGKPTETDYQVNIASNTSEGATSQGFTVAFLEMTVVVTHLTSGETVYKESLSSIKGLQLNKEAASADAYKKGREKIEAEIIKSILEAIL